MADPNRLSLLQRLRGYYLLWVAGEPLPERSGLEIVGATATDDPVNGRTVLTFTGGGGAPVTNTAPVDVGTTALLGVATAAARGDHRHRLTHTTLRTITSGQLLPLGGIDAPASPQWRQTQDSPTTGIAPTDQVWSAQSAPGGDAANGAGFVFQVGAPGDGAHASGWWTLEVGPAVGGTTSGIRLLSEGTLMGSIAGTGGAGLVSAGGTWTFGDGVRAAYITDLGTLPATGWARWSTGNAGIVGKSAGPDRPLVTWDGTTLQLGDPAAAYGDPGNAVAINGGVVWMTATGGQVDIQAAGVTVGEYVNVQANTAFVRVRGDGTILVSGASISLGVTSLGFYGTSPQTKPTVTGSRGGNAALASLLDKLVTLGLITDGTSA